MEDMHRLYTVKTYVSYVQNCQNHAPVSQKRFSSTRRLPFLQPVDQSHLGALLGILGDPPEPPGDPLGEEPPGILEVVALQ